MTSLKFAIVSLDLIHLFKYDFQKILGCKLLFGILNIFLDSVTYMLFGKHINATLRHNYPPLKTSG